MGDTLGMPQEVILAMFSFLTPKELGNVASACHLWKDISEDNELWFELYRDTKKKHLLESLPFTATAHLPGSKAEEKRKEQLRWKERFKETFHIKSGTKFDKVELSLDKNVCEEGGDLSGEMVVTVASEKLHCHGIFVRISGTEKSFAIVGRSVNKNTHDLGEFNFPVYGSHSWESRKSETFTLRRGIYHVPFSFPVSTKGRQGETLPSSWFSKGRGYHVQVEYLASAVLVVGTSIGSVQSSYETIQMMPRAKTGTKQDGLSEEAKAQKPIHKSVQKDFLFGGSATFGVTLCKQSFALGEQIDLLIDINNKSSYAVKSVDITVNEWSLSPCGVGESHPRGTRSCPVDIQKGSQQISLPFTLQWEDDLAKPLGGKAPVKRGYYMQVSLGIPYAVDPKLLIPITLLHPYPH